MTRCAYVYVGDAAAKNFDIGVKSQVWGWKNPLYGDAHPSAVDLLKRPGQSTYLVFGRKIKPRSRVSGWPRTPTDEPWLTANFGELSIARVVGTLYQSAEQVWPDDVYEQRVQMESFTVLGRFSGEQLDPAAITALRDSQNRRGNPVLGPDPLLDESIVTDPGYIDRLRSQIDEANTESRPGSEVAEAGSADVPDDLLHGLNNLDGVTKAVVRLEQRMLRDRLFGKRETIACALCTRVLPIGMVRLAHIKRRADADNQERLMLINTMPACTLGCDELFERGYLTVDSTGKLVGHSTKPASPDLTAEIQRLAGSAIQGYQPEQERFFAWHRERHGVP